MFLSRWLLDLDVAFDGAQALAAVAQADYYIVLMDPNAGDERIRGGSATSSPLERERSATARLPFVAYTSTPLMEVSVELAAAGFDAALAKPAVPASI